MDQDKKDDVVNSSSSNDQNEVSTESSTEPSSNVQTNNNNNTELETTLNNIIGELRQYQVPRTLHDTQNLRTIMNRVNNLMERLRSSQFDIRQQHIDCMEHCLNEIRDIDVNFMNNTSPSAVSTIVVDNNTSEVVTSGYDNVQNVQNVQSRIRNLYLQRINNYYERRRNPLIRNNLNVPNLHNIRQRHITNEMNSMNTLNSGNATSFTTSNDNTNVHTQNHHRSSNISSSNSIGTQFSDLLRYIRHH